MTYIVEMTSFPQRFQTSGLLNRIDEKKLYINTGTFSSPVFVNVSPSGDEETLVIPHSTVIGDYSLLDLGHDADFAANVMIADHGLIAGTWIVEPDDLDTKDADLTTSDSGSLSTGTGGHGWMRMNFGTNVSRLIKIVWSYAQFGTAGQGQWWLEYSVDGSVWQEEFTTGSIAGPTPTTERTDEFTVTAQYVRIRGITTLNRDVVISIKEVYAAPELTDDDTGVVYVTQNVVNPAIQAAIIAPGDKIVGLALFWDGATTETEIAIRISDDNTFIADQNVRVITVSKLVNGAYNFIRFNPVVGQKVQIFGNSGATAILACGQIKLLTKTDEEIAIEHTHRTISTSDTSIGLDGT